MLARRAPANEVGRGDQSVAKGNFLDDVGIVARTAEPLIDHVDEPNVIGAVEAGVHEVGAVDVEDDEPSGTLVCRLG